MFSPKTRNARRAAATAASLLLLAHAARYARSASGGASAPRPSALSQPGPAARPVASAVGFAHVRREAEPSKAQMPLSYAEWKSYTVKDGLPSNEVKCVRVDGTRIWAGTDQGLACFENGAWRTYGVKDGLPHRVVLTLEVAQDTGDLWIGTAGGLARLSGGLIEKFTQTTSGLSNDLVYGISCLGPDVWVATASGVSRYNTRTKNWSLFDHTNTIMFEPWCYAVSAHDDLVYVGVWGAGVVEYNLKTGYWRDYHDPDGETEVCLFKDAGITHEVIPAVSYVNGRLWAGSYFGLSTYDGRHWKNYFKKDSGLASDFVNFVRASGDVGWICTDDGLSGFNGREWITYRKNGEVVRTVNGHAVKTRLPSALADSYTFGVDFQGDSLWVATAGGISHGTLGPAGTLARR